MIQQVLNLMQHSVTAVSSWFGQIMDATGAGTLYIAMMSVVLSVGLLLAPLLGSARAGLSDTVSSATRKGYSKLSEKVASKKG